MTNRSIRLLRLGDCIRSVVLGGIVLAMFMRETARVRERVRL